MQLDFVKSTGAFTLRVPREHAEIKRLMAEDGLDFSERNSTVNEAVLYTREPYAACAYHEYATDAALSQIGHYIPEIKASWAKDTAASFATPDGLELWPFQRAGVEYVMRRKHALIGDQPGLGKTPMGIVTANEMRAKRILVVCPANIRLQWAKQIRAWSIMEGRYIVYPILKSTDGVHPRAEWTIISYDLLRSAPIHRALLEQRFDFVILDEAHYLKTPNARRTKAVFGNNGISSVCGNILGLTGTPLPNRPKECYTISRSLCWEAIDYMTEDEFKLRFNPSKLVTTRVPRLDDSGRQIGFDYKKANDERTGRGPELQARLRANFMVRRLKRDVLDQLPEIRYEIVHVEETGDIRKALEAERMLDIDPNDLSGADAKILGHISTVRMMMGLAKAPQVADYVDMLLEEGEEKLVVFGWHIGVLDILERALHKHGIVRVDGSTSPARRQMAVDRFVDDPQCKGFLGNLQSVGVGVDGLQKVCSRAIFAECSWTPSDNDQGVGRLERIGQNAGILAEFLVAPGSLDERVLSTALRKMQNIHTALDRRM